MSHDRTDSVDRAVLAVIGVLLTVAGTVAILHSTGALGARRRASPVIAGDTARWYASNGYWFWSTLAVVSLVIMVLAVWWASAQIRLPGISRIELERGGAGTVTVASGFLAECIEHDAAAQDDIQRARAKVTTGHSVVHVWLTIWIGPPYDVGRAVAVVTKTVLPNIRALLDGDSPPQVLSHITVESAHSTMSRLS